MRQFELISLENSNTATFLFLDGMDNHTVKSISPLLNGVKIVLEKATDELIQHLHQLKHSEKYENLDPFHKQYLHSKFSILDMVTYWLEKYNKN